MPVETTPQLELVHRLHALLHSMRVIQQQEDEFCTVLHSIECSGRVRAAEGRELARLVTQVPAEALLHDLEAIRASLPAVGAKAEPDAERAHAD